MHEVLLTKEKRLIKIAFWSNFATKTKADVCVVTCLCNCAMASAAQLASFTKWSNCFKGCACPCGIYAFIHFIRPGSWLV